MMNKALGSRPKDECCCDGCEIILKPFPSAVIKGVWMTKKRHEELASENARLAAENELQGKLLADISESLKAYESENERLKERLWQKDEEWQRLYDEGNAKIAELRQRIKAMEADND